MDENGQKQNIYHHSKIYSIRNHVDDDIYIGSTTRELCKRFSEHKKHCKRPQLKHYKLYNKMCEIGAEHFYIELVEEIRCENREQLRKIEGDYFSFHW